MFLSDNLRNTGFFGNSTSAAVLATNPVAVATAFRQNGTDANNSVKGVVAAILAILLWPLLLLDLIAIKRR